MLLKEEKELWEKLEPPKRIDPEYQKEAEQRHRELATKAGGFNDFATLAVIFEQCKSSGAPASWCQKHWIHWRCLFSAFRVEAQLRELIRKLKQQSDFPRETFEGPKHEVLRRCLCAGYFKNVARSEKSRSRWTMAAAVASRLSWLLGWSRPQLELPMSSAAHSGEGSALMWKVLTFFVTLPGVGVSMLNVYLKLQKEHETPEFVAYPHLCIRTKPFP
ncbi:hypothetical protein P7K49_011066 [Saguinus oedipus]|uniref:Uncharacterized protein n=1 Tax=Saguinus oedipus TaxID=9490 RepID=A0ABQ9VPL1_SAGOE|nr:hypothetical protein P7K49_011066 [Saguinus oedipus]